MSGSEKYPFIQLQNYAKYSETDMVSHASSFYRTLSSRRTVRDFSNEPVSREVIETCIRTAGTAPSGANRQPWHFAVIASQELKHKIRIEAEAEEREFYQRRAPQDWLDALAPLGTDDQKPFLEEAPYLIVIFGQKFLVDTEGIKQKNYYVPESVGIATGILITALHTAGLATLTHTPSPMRFLNGLCNRPTTEKPEMILVVGHPSRDAKVPDISRKQLDEIATFHE